MTDTREYDSFGLLIASSGSTATPFGFVGGEGYQRDNDSGLMLLGARLYDPSIGRFISRDPIGLAGGTNVYQYTENDPVNYVDPSGNAKNKGHQNVDIDEKQYQDIKNRIEDWIRRGSPRDEQKDINKDIQKKKMADKARGDRHHADEEKKQEEMKEKQKKEFQRLRDIDKPVQEDLWGYLLLWAMAYAYFRKPAGGPVNKPLPRPSLNPAPAY